MLAYESQEQVAGMRKDVFSSDILCVSVGYTKGALCHKQP